MISINNFNSLLLIWIGIALVIFPVQLFITAPYGRHSKTSWGPMINNKVGWILMELPALVIFGWIVLTSNRIHNVIIMVVFLLWIIHYINRSLIFPLRIKTKNKKMPVLIMLFAIIFNSVNGFINAYWLGNFSEYTTDWLFDSRFIVGIIVFIIGFIINQFHDRILIGLRKNSSGEYQIPQGGLFKYVSCPNFLGEIIEWFGFTILVWSLPALAFFIWTFINLVPRAIGHHKWYKKHFSNYPSQRTAIIPKLL